MYGLRPPHVARDNERYAYSAVSPWTLPDRLHVVGQQSTNILDCDLLFAPAHLRKVHWTCAVADLRNKRFLFFDSYGVPSVPSSHSGNLLTLQVNCGSIAVTISQYSARMFPCQTKIHFL
jgi:hypothetical protein